MFNYLAQTKTQNNLNQINDVHTYTYIHMFIPQDLNAKQ